MEFAMMNHLSINFVSDVAYLKKKKKKDTETIVDVH